MYFKNIFSHYLPGHRSGYGCQDVLLPFITLRKESLDDRDLGLKLTILADISQAFDQGWGQVQYLYLVLVLKYIFISTCCT